jgi:uncharacterized protein (TIGR00730 family)
MPSDPRGPGLTICVFCSSALDIDEQFLDVATEVGARIGSGGHRLVSGGGRVSMMGRVASAARASGAHTIGVIPAHLMGYEVADVDADELVVVDTMRERKALMDAHADLFLVLPGGIGTLEEFFEVWTAGSLGMHPKPVIVLDVDGFFAPLWAFVESLVARNFVRPAAWEQLHRVDRVDEAFALINRVSSDDGRMLSESGDPQRDVSGFRP